MVMVSWWNRNGPCRSINLGVICSMSKRVHTLGGDLVYVKTFFFNSLESSLKIHFIHTILLYTVCIHIDMVSWYDVTDYYNHVIYVNLTVDHHFF